MIEERETRQMELIARTAKLYVDELLDSNARRYFNTSVGANLRNISHLFSSVRMDVLAEKEDRSSGFVWDRMKTVAADFERLGGKRTDAEGELKVLLADVAATYREYVALRDGLDLETESSLRL